MAIELIVGFRHLVAIFRREPGCTPRQLRAGRRSSLSSPGRRCSPAPSPSRPRC